MIYTHEHKNACYVNKLTEIIQNSKATKKEYLSPLSIFKYSIEK